MILEVKNTIRGDFIAPKSKSIAIRAAFAAFLANKEVRLLDYPSNTDSQTALKIIQQLGGSVEPIGNDVVINGSGITFPEIIFCGESGLCLNISLALAQQSKFPVVLTGEKTLITRNLSHITNNLIENGIQFKIDNNKLPLTIYPDPSLSLYNIDGSDSSQLATGLLFASLYNNDLRFNVRNLVSKSYFELSRKLLFDFGYQTKIKNEFISVQKISEPPAIYSIEGDYSGVANILVAAAISGEISVQGLDPDSLQADRIIIDILKRVGAEVNFNKNILRVKSKELRPFVQSIEDCPDLFPILCVLATYTEGLSTISGIERLKYKESNRLLVMVNELRKAGGDIRFDNTTAVIRGKKLKGADFSSQNDHRIAMALTIAAMFATSPSTLSNPECVEKSYPDFFQNFGINP
jgi:3-phosphoshikimate 1-carboxyvinyltransferase